MKQTHLKAFTLLLVGSLVSSSLSIASPALLDELRDSSYLTEGGGLKNKLVLAMQGKTALVDWETELRAVVLDEKLHLDARRLAADLLSACVTENSVESLIPLLEDPRLVHNIRVILEPLQDPRVDAGLIAALDRTSGDQQMGVVSSLVSRESAMAVPALIRLLETSRSPEIATLCLRAIGTIGGQEALSYLEAGSPAPKIASIHKDWEAALASVYLADNSSIPAASREAGLRALLRSSEQPALRAASMLGLVKLRPDDYQALLLMFASRTPGDPVAAAAALPYLQRSPQALDAIVGTVDVLPADSRRLLLQALTRLEEPLALQIARSQFEKAKEAPLVLASLDTIAHMGTLDDARRLLSEIREGAPYMQDALDTLSRIPDTSINPWVLEQFFKMQGDVQNKLASVIAARGLREHLPAVVSELDTIQVSARQATYRLLGELGTEDTASSLIARRAAVSDAEKRLLERTIVTIGRRGPTERVSEELASLMMDSVDSEKDTVVRMIGAIENVTSLGVLQTLLDSNPKHEVAARSLVAWRAPIAMPVLSQLALNEEAIPAVRTAAWGTMLRISREALRDWHRDRELFWEMTFKAALADSQIKEMLAVVLEVPRGQLIPWLEAGVDHPSLGESYAETLANLRILLDS